MTVPMFVHSRHPEAMRRLNAFVLLAGVMSTAAEPVREYRIDAGHTSVTFSIGFLGLPVQGRFDDVKGAIAYVPGNPSASAVTIVIGARSISTGSAHRDEHLKTADFLDVAKYPVIVFRSASIMQRGASLVMTGPLTMHGVTRNVTIPFRETVAPVTDPHGSNLVFFSGRVRVARKDFGIAGGSRFNPWFDALRSRSMGDSVDISLDVSGWEPDAARATAYDAAIARIDKEGANAMVQSIAAMPADSARAHSPDLELMLRVLQTRGKHAEAVVLGQALSLKLGSDAAAHALLARTYELAGNDALARAAAWRALAIDSLNPRALELGRRLGIAVVR